MRFILLLIIIMSTCANAEGAKIYLDLKSHHFKPKSYYIENHDLFGIERDRWLFVRYTNSEGRLSTMIGRRVVWGSFGRFSYGAKYGMVTGYNTKILGDFAPFGLLNGVISVNRCINIDINFIPAVVVSFGMRVDL